MNLSYVLSYKIFVILIRSLKILSINSSSSSLVFLKESESKFSAHFWFSFNILFLSSSITIYYDKYCLMFTNIFSWCEWLPIIQVAQFKRSLQVTIVQTYIIGIFSWPYFLHFKLTTKLSTIELLIKINKLCISIIYRN